MDFQSLPEPERNYNLQMSGETLKYVCAVAEALHRLHLHVREGILTSWTWFLILLSMPSRTLLALGCHVGMGDEKAEENLKKIKLPKTYVKISDCICQPTSSPLFV